MTINNRLHGIDKGFATCQGIEGQQRVIQVQVPDLLQLVMEEDPFLEWCQGVDILHVTYPALNAAHNLIDLALREGDQRQQVGRDASRPGKNAVGWGREG